MKGIGLAVLAVVVLFSFACGDDDTSPVTLTVVNTTDGTVDVFINGQHSSLDAGDEDAITLEGSGEYSVLVTSPTGATLYTETLTAGDIRDLDGRLVVSAATVSPS